MYLNHWGLDRAPFRAVADRANYYPAPAPEEALARIEFLVQAKRRLGVLCGATGSGKSLVLQVAARQLVRQGYAVSRIDAFGVNAREFLWQLASDLGTGPAMADEPLRLWRRISDRIAENRMQQIGSVLLLDDADAAGPDLASLFVRLARLDPTPDSRWTIILAASAERAVLWPAALRQAVDLRMDLPAWDEGVTTGFVQTALVDAGCLEPIFTAEALAELPALAAGNPGQVARLAESALTAGAAAAQATIDVAQLRSAAAQLDQTLIALA